MSEQDTTTVSAQQFGRLVRQLQTATPPAAPAYRPYPWPEEEMITRYGLRRLTADEQEVFPSLSLALDVFKARLTKPPAVAPNVRKGWVTWVAETYPGSYLVRLPGGASLIAPYHDIAWERVPVDVPTTTIEEIWAEERRLQEEARKWRPGQMITTPYTRLAWSSLSGWLSAWGRLQRRPHSSDRYWKEDEHIRALPIEMIAAETDKQALYDFLEVMDSGNARQPKGMRDEDPATPLVVAANNRLARLGAVPYRQYRQQQSLRRALAPDLTTPRPQPGTRPAASDLSLF
ncbi:MAG: hypothetical protein L0332_27065 [Chloroflexi bacterium]|nr:hypothetical protein [Chloroflexota bacterium]MCI0580259.1 hypothetical protein [Chloroflexota bacterium]MCI0649642.1 hypothetical protein [Chloroflexota bacterium]MCI0730360.1 hypothetical protein [Chloroflexota bacterium]